MKFFFNLVNLNINNYYASSSLYSKRKKSTIFLYALIFLYLFACLCFLSYLIGSTLSKENLELLLVFGITSTFIVCLFNSLFSGTSFLFNSKDNDFLCSLPIKNTVVFLSKLFSMLLMFYTYTFFTYIPFTVVYFILNGATFIGIFYSILGFFLVPILPLVIGTIINLLLNLITSTNKYKNIIQYILIFILLFVSLYINFNSTQIISLITSNSEKTYNLLTYIYFPAKFLSKSITTFKFLDFLYFTLSSLIPFILFTIILSHYYVKINSRLQKTHKIVSHNKISLKQKSPFVTILTKELKKIFSNVTYFINSCFGPILLVIISIASLFGLQYLIVGNAVESDIVSVMSLVTILISINGPLTVTFSLEGSSFWIYKSLPINHKQIINIKLLSEIILFLPLTIIATIIFSISLKLTFLTTFFLVLYSIVICIFCSIIHLWIGIKKHNLNYTNETQVIKQSSGVLFSTLFGFIFSFILIILYNFILKICPINWFIVGIIIVFAVLSIFFYSKKLNLTQEQFLDIK